MLRISSITGDGIEELRSRLIKSIAADKVADPLTLPDTWHREVEEIEPVGSPEEIEASGFDYLALGHVHVFSLMEHGLTKAAYCGSPNTGLGKDDMSAALVELNPQKGVFVNKLDLLPRTF